MEAVDMIIGGIWKDNQIFELIKVKIDVFIGLFRNKELSLYFLFTRIQFKYLCKYLENKSFDLWNRYIEFQNYERYY